MKVFACTHCGQQIFFDSTRCETCKSALGFIPERAEMAAFSIQANGVWERLGDDAPTMRYRPCHNYAVAKVCNWMVGADTAGTLCRSCAYTAIIPPLSLVQNQRYWYLLEAAKRRLIYALDEFGLAIPGRSEDPQRGLVFHFLEDAPSERVMTGHDNGLITLNIVEADDAQREARRTALGEPYRTLLGHFRHEIGHFYWDLLIENGPWAPACRQLFGDETRDYAQALKQHYESGAPDDWPLHYISSYASVHPWEDWAETWAHYLHISDALNTAAHWSASFSATDHHAPVSAGDPIDDDAQKFCARVVEQWLPLAQFLNSMNRSLGQHDSYPFVLADPVIAKLAFVHRVVRAARGLPVSAWPPPFDGVITPALPAEFAAGDPRYTAGGDAFARQSSGFECD